MEIGLALVSDKTVKPEVPHDPVVDYWSSGLVFNNVFKFQKRPIGLHRLALFTNWK
jgi:hypothetical protein